MGVGASTQIIDTNYMRKTILLLIIIRCTIGLSAQHTLTETDKLISTAKIWGFLKYYHPQVSKGQHNWDEELFNILPKIKHCDNRDQLSQIYIEWINSLGTIEKCKTCIDNSNLDYFNKNFNLEWIENRNFFTKELSEKLRFIESNRHQGEKYYVALFNEGNVNILNESEYIDFEWQNEHLRLLTLFRYWNIIEYFFPYKYQTDTNWDVVLKNMIPRFLYPKDEIDFHLAILELIVSIDDSHAYFSTRYTYASFGFYLLPIKFKLVDDKAIITGFNNETLAKVDDLRISDVITSVGKQEVDTLFRKQEKFTSGSNISRKKANSKYTIFNGSSDSVEIEFIRNDKIYSKTVKRYTAMSFNYDSDSESVKYKILDNNIGYVNMGALRVEDVPSVMENLKDTRAIIFDIRNYPNGTLYSIVNYISSKKNNFYKIIYPDLNYPGKFIWKDGRQCGENEELKYSGKVVLLVNEETQSHAEFSTMCLQTGDNVTTIGSQTSGADGNVSRIKIAGGHKTAFSGIGIFYPDKTETQRIGVKIDIEIKPTIGGISKGKDEVLERAIEYINN
ncbi:MAG: hypothetical protein HC811_10465 [Flammeovirgaceae bacterium]|nr:hypothetical protein [Flammeovirgaceae bacterium]